MVGGWGGLRVVGVGWDGMGWDGIAQPYSPTY